MNLASSSITFTLDHPACIFNRVADSVRACWKSNVFNNNNVKYFKSFLMIATKVIRMCFEKQFWSELEE